MARYLRYATPSYTCRAFNPQAVLGVDACWMHTVSTSQNAPKNIPPTPLSPAQVAALVELLADPPAGEEAFLVELLTERVPPGVDEAAYVKAGFLSALARGESRCSLIDKAHAVRLLGDMHGGYNISTLVGLLNDEELGDASSSELKQTLLMFDAFHDVAELAKAGSRNAQDVMESWAAGEWFTGRDEVPESIKMVVFKVAGETNTDDLSPAPDAWSRPDIPLHALAMFKMARDGIEPDDAGTTGPLKQIEAIKSKGLPVAFVGDVVGTGSSRKSATNSVLWYFGEDTPGIPNKRAGGVCIGGKVAPIFYNTMEDAGALVFEAPVDQLAMGDVMKSAPTTARSSPRVVKSCPNSHSGPRSCSMKSALAGASI